MKNTITSPLTACNSIASLKPFSWGDKYVCPSCSNLVTISSREEENPVCCGHETTFYSLRCKCGTRTGEYYDMEALSKIWEFTD